MGLRHSISFPHEIIVLLDEMFDKNVMDELDLDYVPNLLFNDCEEWEKLPNSELNVFLFFSYPSIIRPGFG